MICAMTNDMSNLVAIPLQMDNFPSPSSFYRDSSHPVSVLIPQMTYLPKMGAFVTPLKFSTRRPSNIFALSKPTTKNNYNILHPYDFTTNHPTSRIFNGIDHIGTWEWKLWIRVCLCCQRAQSGLDCMRYGDTTNIQYKNHFTPHKLTIFLLIEIFSINTDTKGELIKLLTPMVGFRSWCHRGGRIKCRPTYFSVLLFHLVY